MSKPTPIVAVVAALLPEFGIGYKGKMPWRLREEIRYFRKITSFVPTESTVNAVIMGRKTWESIPPRFRPLPDRINVILSRSTSASANFGEGTIVASSIDDALLKLQNQEKQVARIYVIGGAEIYNSLIENDRISHVLLTEINMLQGKETPPMDTFLKFSTTGEKWSKNTTEELKGFIGDATLEIPESITEGDYNYRYTLWTRN